MNFTKNKAFSVVISILVLILFNAVAFMIPTYHSTSFWMGYGFACFSNLFLLFTLFYTLSASHKNMTVHRLPELRV